MKKFLIKTSLFTIIVIGVFAVPMFCIPNYQYEASILGAIPDKHVLLSKIAAPKIVFIGGSNLSMGLDSKKVADFYHIPVFNNTTSLWPGLKFMIKDVQPFVKEGDYIVISAEYCCFDETYDKSGFEGFEALLAIVFDIFPKGVAYIDYKQWGHLLPYIPHYIVSQINYWLFNRVKTDLKGMLGRQDFNKYGDLYHHWDWGKKKFKIEPKCTGNEQVNPDVMPFLVDFNNYVKSRGATLVFIPPPLQDTTYNNLSFIINKIAADLKKNNLQLIAAPARYKFADKYMNDFYYHLTKPGVDIRTNLVIQDLSKIIKANINSIK